MAAIQAAALVEKPMAAILQMIMDSMVAVEVHTIGVGTIVALLLVSPVQVAKTVAWAEVIPVPHFQMGATVVVFMPVVVAVVAHAFQMHTADM